MLGDELIGRIGGVDRFQRRVVFRPEKGERSGQRPRADSRDDVERRVGEIEGLSQAQGGKRRRKSKSSPARRTEKPFYSACLPQEI